MRRALSMGSAVILAALPVPVLAEPVLFISIDGLQPADVIEAEKRGIEIPNLSRFIAQGSYASGVIGVLPSVTYPSHATLISGVSPDKHGIVGNTTFDPMQINQGGWYWYAGDIKVPTLWDAAQKSGLKVANVHWPVSVGAASINWNIPQIWRTGHSDDAKLVKSLATPGLIEGLEIDLGPYADGIDESIEGDENRGRFAVRLIEQQKPDFTTVYLTALDHEQHGKGPDTKAAHAILQRIDKIVGKLVSAQIAAHPDSVIAVASDHGFAATDTEINLFRAFIDAGLITLDNDGKVTTWDAMPWPAGGSIAVILARPDDTALTARVLSQLNALKDNAENRIERIADPTKIAEFGANPQASFYLNLAPGALAGGYKGKVAEVVGRAKSKGTHGYFPDAANMRSTFMIMGPGIAKGRNIGEIDMRAIAPTLAQIMSIELPDAKVRLNDKLIFTK